MIDVEFCKEVYNPKLLDHDSLHVVWDLIRAEIPLKTPPLSFVKRHTELGVECHIDDELNEMHFDEQQFTVVLPHFCDVSEDDIIFHYVAPELSGLHLMTCFVRSRIDFSRVKGTLPLDLVASTVTADVPGLVAHISVATAWLVGSFVNGDPRHKASDLDILVCQGFPLYLAVGVLHELLPSIIRVDEGTKIHVFSDPTGLGPHGPSFPLIKLSLCEGVWK